MDNKLIILLILSEVVSLVLLFKLLFKDIKLWLKVVGGLILLIPFVGPLMYLFAFDDTKPQSTFLQNNRSRGDYTHNWISIKSILKKKIKIVTIMKISIEVQITIMLFLSYWLSG